MIDSYLYVDQWLAIEGNTQHKLAQIAGVEDRYISEVLAGRHRPNADIVPLVSAELVQSGVLPAALEHEFRWDFRNRKGGRKSRVVKNPTEAVA